MISCVKCRSRKVRCDRAKPTCGRCKENNQRCEYAGKRKPGPHRGHARELHDKVDQLERSLESLRGQLHEHLIPPNDRENLSLGQRKPLWDSQDNVLQSSGATGTAVASHSRLRTVAVNRNPDLYEYDDLLTKAGLPPHRQLAALVDLYFEHVNVWLPLLEQGSILELLRNPLELSESDQILLHALVLSGSRFWTEQNTIQKNRETSKQRIRLYVLEYSNIRGLQALAIFTVDVLGDGHTVEGMNLLTLLAQNFSHLGLGQERRFDLGLFIDAPAGLTQGSMLPHPTSWRQEEEMRRLFWAVYSIDRYTNTCTSSNFMIDERGVNTPLPCQYALWAAGEQVETRWYRTDVPFEVTTDRPENLGSFSYLCEVMRIMTHIHEFAKQPLDFYSSSDINRWKNSYSELDRQLSSWLQTLPGEYADISETCRSDTRSKVSNWITLQSGFILAAVRLHSVAAYPPMTSELFKASHSAMHKCLTAVTSMKRTAQDVVSTGMLQLLGPPFAGALWVTARLLLIHASVPEHHLDPSVYFFISALEKMGEHWPLAKVFASRLACMLPHSHTGDNAGSLEDLRRVAFRLHIVEAEQRYAFSQRCIFKTLPINELQAFGVFDSFNYPRPSNGSYHVSNSGDVTSTGSCPDVRFSQPDPCSDWIDGH